MAGPGYVGLATGAGAAEGLGEVLRRLLMEEQLAQGNRRLDLEGRGLDIQSRNVDQQHQARMGGLGLEAAGLPSLIAQRQGAAAASQGNAALDQERLGIISGLKAGDPGMLEGMETPHSPARLRMRAVGMTPDPISQPDTGTIPEWQARLKGFEGFTPEQVQDAGAPNADRDYALRVRREERLDRERQTREESAKKRFDMAVQTASTKTQDQARLAAFRMGLAKRLSAEVSKPFLGIFGEEIDNQIDAIVSEELAALDNPQAGSQENVPTGLPQGVTVRPRPRR